MMTFRPTAPQTTKFQQSISDFRNARQRAAMENVVGRLTGKSSSLLSYDDVIRKLKVVNQAERGVRDIPVDKIVGSVGRYTDFSSSFLPKMDTDATRWARVASVPFDELPPIDVYQIGDVYFVLDGNHRVSIARQRGMLYIPADVTEVRTRAPLPPNVSPEKLILQAEYAAFLENTNIDKLRPEADLRVSVPGQYRKLENHMVAHRFLVEMAEETELSDKEAVIRWYDESYLPVVEAVREQGILKGFPNRTETDLYLWISEHQAQLRNELGWQVRPEVATAVLADRVDNASENRIARFGKNISRTVLNLVAPRESKPAVPSWSQTKVAARYSDRLFADLLVVLTNETNKQVTLDQALLIAGREDSRLHGLCLELERSEDSSHETLKSWFEAHCRAAGLDGRLAVQTGDPIQIICDRARLADLVITGRSGSMGYELELLTLLRQSPRPVLITSGSVVAPDNILLAYDGGEKSNEALFAAAYIAEQWGAALTVVLAPEEPGAEEDAKVDHARRYLEMHEVEAFYVICGVDPVGLLIDTATEKAADLIVLGGYSDRRFGRSGTGNVVNQLVAKWKGPILICP